MNGTGFVRAMDYAQICMAPIYIYETSILARVWYHRPGKQTVNGSQTETGEGRTDGRTVRISPIPMVMAMATGITIRTHNAYLFHTPILANCNFCYPVLETKSSNPCLCTSSANEATMAGGIKAVVP